MIEAPAQTDLIKNTTVDWCLVSVDSRYENVIRLSNNTELLLDTSFKPLTHAKITGTVLAIPKKLSHQPLYEIYQGEPHPSRTRYISHDFIQKNYANKTGYTEKLLQSLYVPGIYEPNFFYQDKIPILLEPGTQVYFHYLSLQPDNYLGQDEKGNYIYFIHYNQIFGRLDTFRQPVPNKPEDTVSVTAITMINNFVLTEKYYGTLYKEIKVDDRWIHGKTKTIKTPEGSVELVTETNEKEEYLHGRVRYIGPPVGPLGISSVKPGDVIIFTPKSEFENKINDKEYYTMRQTDIVAKVDEFPLRDLSEKETNKIKESGSYKEEEFDPYHRWVTYAENGVWSHTIIPVADWVLIDPINWKPTNLMLPVSLKHKPRKGKVLRVGELVEKIYGCEIETDNIVEFCNSNPHSFIYLKEYNKVLVRYGDIYYKEVSK